MSESISRTLRGSLDITDCIGQIIHDLISIFLICKGNCDSRKSGDFFSVFLLCFVLISLNDDSALKFYYGESIQRTKVQDKESENSCLFPFPSASVKIYCWKVFFHEVLLFPSFYIKIFRIFI